MKNEKWLMYLIVGFTSITTVLLLQDGTFLGFVRGLIAAAILDGLIVYWDNKRTTLKSNQQRQISERMMWAGVGIMLTFAAGYGVEIFAPVDAVTPVDLFGFSFILSLTEVILMLAASAIGVWVVLTLGVILYLRGIDPEIMKELDRVKSESEAEDERNKEEARAYKTAMKVTARAVGTEKALKAYRANLESQDFYKPFEIDSMVELARQQIEAEVTGGIPVDVNVRQYHSETTNPTPPSTPQK
jgi:hypothetical protein